MPNARRPTISGVVGNDLPTVRHHLPPDPGGPGQVRGQGHGVSEVQGNVSQGGVDEMTNEQILRGALEKIADHTISQRHWALVYKWAFEALKATEPQECKDCMAVVESDEWKSLPSYEEMKRYLMEGNHFEDCPTLKATEEAKP